MSAAHFDYWQRAVLKELGYTLYEQRSSGTSTAASPEPESTADTVVNDTIPANTSTTPAAAAVPAMAYATLRIADGGQAPAASDTLCQNLLAAIAQLGLSVRTRRDETALIVTVSGIADSAAGTMLNADLTVLRQDRDAKKRLWDALKGLSKKS